MQEYIKHGKYLRNISFVNNSNERKKTFKILNNVQTYFGRKTLKTSHLLLSKGDKSTPLQGLIDLHQAMPTVCISALN